MQMARARAKRASLLASKPEEAAQMMAAAAVNQAPAGGGRPLKPWEAEAQAKERILRVTSSGGLMSPLSAASPSVNRARTANDFASPNSESKRGAFTRKGSILAGHYVNLRDAQERLGGMGVREPAANPQDPFDTQRCVNGWKQDFVERQSCLVLGLGGVGCSVAIALARLGVRQLVVVDSGSVGVSDLNRQILFEKRHVGAKKAELAADALKRHVVGNTEVAGVVLDVVKQWDRVVLLTQKCTAVFNCLNINRVADFAVASLAKSFGVPYIAATAFAYTAQVEATTSSSDSNSQALVASKSSAALQQVFGSLHPSVIQRHASIYPLVTKVKLNAFDRRQAGNSALTSLSCGVLAVTAFTQLLFGGGGGGSAAAAQTPNFASISIDGFWKEGEVVAAAAPPSEQLPQPGDAMAEQ